MPRGVSGWPQAVDSASIAVFRIAFGACMLGWVGWMFGTGRIEQSYSAPSFHFTYYGFGWMGNPPLAWMDVLFAVLGVASVLIALGLFYRVSIAIFFASFTYAFLVERSNYQNHYYLICLVSFILCFVPAHRTFSLD